MIQLIKNTLLSISFMSLIPLIAEANEVKMYANEVPSADEMANILLNAPAISEEESIKTRSIVVTPNKQSSNISIGIPINFDFNSSVLNSDSVSYVKQIGIMLNLEKMANEKIMIIGHTDASGPEYYNLVLSQKRAHAVKSFLKKNYNIAENRIKTAGKGELEPLKDRNPYDSLNRRVELFRIQ